MAYARQSSGGSPASRTGSRASTKTRRWPIAVTNLATAKRYGSEPDTSEDQSTDSTETRTLARVLDQR